MNPEQPTPEQNQQAMNLIVWPALKPIRIMVIVLLALAIITNILTVNLPKETAALLNQLPEPNAWPVIILIIAIFSLSATTTVLGSYFAQQFAYNVRSIVFSKLVNQPFKFISQQGSGKLLSNLTSDVDTIRDVVNQVAAQIISAVVLLLGSAFILLTTNWQLALAALAVLPILAIVFFLVLRTIVKYFEVAKIVTDNLNRIISESVAAAGLVRVLNTQESEKNKLTKYNLEAKDVGIKILKGFGIMIPTIGLISSLATLIILYFGGNMLTQGQLSFGDFVAFNTYLSLLIFPILILGFLGSSITSAFVSLNRLTEIVTSSQESLFGNFSQDLKGEIAVQNVKLSFENREVLKGVSLRILPKQRTAILGPTGSGKTQLMYLMSGLIKPTEGQILYDYKPLYEYSQKSFYEQVGVVFQDSVLFNTTIRENVAFKTGISEDSIWKALETAELADYVRTLPEGLETKISERGTNLSGGQKQRLMLARSLAANSKILFLDDFTARVDVGTEARIWQNLQTNYPELTLVVITQKVSTAEKFDNVILLMEGELLASGTHAELVESSIEYVQIVNSQQSTEHK